MRLDNVKMVAITVITIRPLIKDILSTSLDSTAGSWITLYSGADNQQKNKPLVNNYYINSINSLPNVCRHFGVVTLSVLSLVSLVTVSLIETFLLSSPDNVVSGIARSVVVVVVVVFSLLGRRGGSGGAPAAQSNHDE